MSNPAKTQNGKSSEEKSDKRPQVRLILESLQVKHDRIVAKVRVGDPADAFTTPELAGRLVRIRPDLPIHTCVNGRGPTFGVVLANTPLPHVLEHVVIDLQAAECENPDYVFTGVTRWVDRRAGQAQVEVSYADDIVGLRAFRDATEIINSL
jgi:hypothetical protein